MDDLNPFHLQVVEDNITFLKNVWKNLQLRIISFFRKLQQLENVLKIPVVDHFSETFAGLEVIRALDRENSFTKTLLEKIDHHTNVFLILNSTNRWLGIMLVSSCWLVDKLVLSLYSLQNGNTLFFKMMPIGFRGQCANAVWSVQFLANNKNKEIITYLCIHIM